MRKIVNRIDQEMERDVLLLKARFESQPLWKYGPKPPVGMCMCKGIDRYWNYLSTIPIYLIIIPIYYPYLLYSYPYVLSQSTIPIYLDRDLALAPRVPIMPRDSEVLVGG